MEILPQLILNSIIAGAIYTLVALGFNLVYGATKFFNLAHVVMVAIGGYAVFYFTKTLGWDIYLAVIVGVLFTGMVDTIYLIAEAIKVNGYNVSKVTKYLNTVKYDGVGGQISFDANNDRSNAEYSLFVVKNGQAVLVQ